MPRLRHLTTTDENALQTWFMGANAPLSARVATLEAGAMPSTLPARMTAAETGIANLAQRLTTDEAAITSNTNRLTALESGSGSFSTWKNAKASKINNPTATTSVSGLNVVGVGTLLTVGSANTLKAAIDELQAWAASVSSSIFVGRSLMAAS